MNIMNCQMFLSGVLLNLDIRYNGNLFCFCHFSDKL